VAVAPRTLRDMNVVMARAQWRNLTRQIHSVGLVALDENRLSHVHPRASGWVETLNVRALGDTVKKGETLLTVYSPDILSAEKDFLVALKSGMPEMRDAARDRLRLLSVPESVIEQIARTGKVARTIPVLAPQSGYISVINLRDGMYVTPNLDMFTIADASKIWVQVEVLPRDMEQVAVGQPAEMTVDGVPGRVWKGTVDFIYPELDPKSRTLKVRLVFDNPDGVLKPNQFAEVGISGVAQADVLTVPTSAVIPTPQGARVVRKNADGSFQPVRVDVGQSADGWTQISAGLSPDDRVVASGQFLIDSESSIQASFARMTGTAQPADDAAPAASGQHQH
ncbi:MAG: efflux RND transporter periplasmic adaptor subunit, partial [Halothiobacillus sp.]